MPLPCSTRRCGPVSRSGHFARTRCRARCSWKSSMPRHGGQQLQLPARACACPDRQSANASSAERFCVSTRAAGASTFSPFPDPMPPDCAARVGEFRPTLLRRTRHRSHRQGGALPADRPQLYLRRARWALTKHSWLDCGLFLQNIILAAHVRGLATCPQVSFVRYQTLIADRLGLGSDELVACGLSLGYAEPQAPVNRLNMPREPLDNVARWLGFDE